MSSCYICMCGRRRPPLIKTRYGSEETPETFTLLFEPEPHEQWIVDYFYCTGCLNYPQQAYWQSRFFFPLSAVESIRFNLGNTGYCLLLVYICVYIYTHIVATTKPRDPGSIMEKTLLWSSHHFFWPCCSWVYYICIWRFVKMSVPRGKNSRPRWIINNQY